MGETLAGLFPRKASTEEELRVGGLCDLRC